MEMIYYSLLLVAVAIGSSYITTLLPRVKAWFSRVINARRNKISRRIEQLEMRVELHTRKDGTYLDKFDELEEQIDNLSKSLANREKNRKSWTRTEVRKYLEELQK